MSTRSLLLIAAIWVTIGVIVAFTMRRRGHDFYAWLVMGAILGPLSIPLAVSRDIDRHRAGAQEGAPAPVHEGFDVLAGIDGSDESLEALVSAIRMFGSQTSSVTVATVLTYDDESSPAGLEAQIEAEKMLEEVVRGLRVGPVHIKLLFGRPDDALIDYANAAGIELIVVGARGHHATEAMFGSVAGRLVGHSPVPVFVGPSPS